MKALYEGSILAWVLFPSQMARANHLRNADFEGLSGLGGFDSHLAES